MEMDLPTNNKEVFVTTTLADEPQPLDQDEVVLARFNKKQKLLRRFGTLPAVGITCTLMITWEAMTVDLLAALQNGGPAGCVILYLVAWAGACLQGLVFAELASMVPLAGGPFNWVAIFAPRWCRKFLSYLAGWLTMISYCALVAGTCYITGTLIQALIGLKNPDYASPNYQGTLLYWGAIALSLVINTYMGHLLPQIESILLFLHILAFIAILVPIVYLGDHVSAKEVFTTFINNGDWNTQTLAVFIGSATMLNSFCGLDGVDHVAEELHDAPRTIPIAIGSSLALNGAMGFAMLLALLFCMPADIQALLTAQPYYPFIGIYQNAMQSDSGAIALTALVIVTNTAGAIGIVATASRMVWAFAREGGLPGSRYLSRVNPKSHLPLWSIAAVVFVNILIGLINIGSTVGFTALMSLIVAGYYSSFVLAACVMLHKRLTTPDHEIPWGPFRLGRWGVPVTALAIAYSVIGAFFSMWPTTVNPSIQSMNYCVLVYGGALLFAIIFWFAHGKKRYTGPILEIMN